MGWGARPAVVGRRPSTVLRGLVVVVVVVVMIVVAVVVMMVTAAAAATSPAMDPAILIRISRRTIVVVVVSDCRVVAGAPYPCMRGSARSLPPDISQL